MHGKRQTKLLEHVATRAETTGDATALVFPAPGEALARVSWADLWRAVLRVTGHLAAQGVGSGDSVLVLSASPREQIVGLLAAVAAGAVPTVLSFPSLRQSLADFAVMLAAVSAQARA